MQTQVNGVTHTGTPEEIAEWQARYEMKKEQLKTNAIVKVQDDKTEENPSGI